MSLVLSLKQAPADTLDLLIARPELAVVFWINPAHTPPKTPALLLWIAKLFGHYEPPMELPEAPAELDRTGKELRLDRQVGPLFGTVGEAILTELGQPIVGSSHGHGDERAVYPKQLSGFLQTLEAAVHNDSRDDLRQDAERLNRFLSLTHDASLGAVVQLS